VAGDHPLEVKVVVDPALTARQRRLRRFVDSAAHPFDKMLIEYAGPLALIVCLIAWLVSGLATPRLSAAAIAAIVSLVVPREVTSGALRRCRNLYVDPSALDSVSGGLCGSGCPAMVNSPAISVRRCAGGAS
jgi:hypothetical protein